MRGGGRAFGIVGARPRPQASPGMPQTTRFLDLSPLLAPASMAVVGAVEGTDRAGGRPVPYSARCGFRGPIYPVNPGRREVDGRRCYPTVADLPETPELAVVVVRAARAVEAVRGCVERGVRALVILSAGFREAGGEGARREEEIVRLARSAGALVCGPNSLGVANLHAGLFASFSSALDGRSTEPGPVAFVSQSGMLGGLAMSELTARGVGLGAMVSVGNEAGVDVADAVAHFAGDPAIRVIGGYVEGARDGRRLVDALGLARDAGKRVALLKVGRTPEAARAAFSHTGALAGTHRAYRAAFEAAGAVEAGGVEELFDVVEAAARLPAPPAPRGGRARVAVFTNSGGFGALAADDLHRAGLGLARFAPATEARLRARLPSYVAAANPVDVALQAIEEEGALASHLEAFLADPGVDAVLGIFGLYRPRDPVFVDAVCRASAESGKPVVFACPHSAPELRERLAAAGVPVFDAPDRAARALAGVFRRAPPPEAAAPLPPSARAAVAGVLARLGGRGPLSEGEGGEILAAAGVPTARLGLAACAEEAAALAAAAGGRVALKVESPDIPHKTEAGGVALGVEGADEARAACGALLGEVGARAPGARIDGVGVHRMVEGAVEVLAGVRRDPAFGPLAVAGAGGAAAEVLDDVALRPTPLGEEGAARLFRALRCAPLLEGARGRPRADVAAAARALARIAALADAFPRIAEIEINPLLVLPEGGGAVAGDALVVLDADVPAA